MAKNLSDLPQVAPELTDTLVGLRAAGIRMTVQSVVDLIGESPAVQDYILIRNVNTGTVWKLELVGSTDDTTEPKWTPQ